MKTIIALIILFPTYIFSQLEVQNLGLKNKSITSLEISYGILSVGTDKNGVYWSQFESLDSIDWKHIELPGKNIRTVYPHKSGPIGWAIGAGIRPEKGDTNFVYCSYMGEEFRSISSGIDRNLTHEISQLDGFPDPTICGETFAAGGRVLYRRYFGDTVWHPVYNLTIEGNFTTVKAKENFPTVIAGGGEGFANHLLIKSYDKGDTWESISPLIYVQSLDFIDDSAKVIFVSDNSSILKSNDFGLTWTEVFDSNNEFIINELLYYPYPNMIFAVGTTDWDTGRGIVYYNDLSTEDWYKLPVDIDNPIVDIDYGFDDWVYIATKDSGVYRFRNLIVDVDNEYFSIPKAFTLLQNYPNPFNPTTTIKYTIPISNFIAGGTEQSPTPKIATGAYIPRDEYVQLKVYDILGSEITTLVNQPQKPGHYEIAFDASRYSSGIYFYQLKTEDFIQVKKMIYLK
jgi:Secretion system C-terminal sorting domain